MNLNLFVRMRYRRALLALAVLVIFLLGLAVVAQVDVVAQGSSPSTLPPEPPSARRGRIIYQANCATCHGDQGLGEGPSAAGLEVPPVQFADAAVARQASLVQWFQVAKDGRMEHMMPPWGSRLSEQEIWDVVTYAWTLHLEEGELERGAEIYQSSCAECHGDAGKGDGPEAPPDTPDLTIPEMLNHSLAEWFDLVTAGQDAMPGFADTLSEEQRWAVLEYVRSFSFAPMQPPTFEPGDGVITGTVSNNTPSGEIPAGITVTLHVFDAETFDDVRDFESVTDEQGVFRFEELSTSSDWVYRVTLDYKGVPYASEIKGFPEGETELDLPVPVYEPTEDGSGIRIERAHWFIDFEGQNLIVGEMYIISMDGDRVYVGGEEVAPGRRVTLRFPLPSGYHGLIVEPGPLGQRFFEVEGSVVDTLPVPPGEAIRQVLIRYVYPYQEKSLDLQHTLAYPTVFLNVLISDIGVEVSSPQVVFQDRQGMSGQQYLNFVGSNLAAGEMITLSFKKLPLGGEGAGASSSALTVPVVVSVVVVILAGVFLLFFYPGRQREQPAAPRPPRPRRKRRRKDVSDLETERERLIMLIARLDDEYEAGNIAEDVYQQERARRKAQLLQVIQEIEELGGA